MRQPNRSRGVATLELVMCMPILLVLMIGIVWLGFSVIGQSEVTIEARHKAWQQRFDSGIGKPLYFLADDFISEDATKEVNVSPLLADVSPPESSHDVGTATWGHEQVNMNRPPNWELYLIAAANAKSGGLQVPYTGAENFLNQLQTVAADAVREEIENVIRNFLDNPFAGFTGGAGASQDENDREAQQEKARLTAEIEQLDAEIEATEKKIEQLESGADENQDDDNEEEDDQQRIDDQREIQENKLERLKNQRKWKQQDLAAIG